MIVNYSDHSANERTFLAWVRTAIAVVGFGLATARLSPGQPAHWSEALLLVTGALVCFLAYLRMLWLRRRIRAIEELDDGAVPTDTLLLLMIGAMFALLASFGLHVG